MKKIWSAWLFFVFPLPSLFAIHYESTASIGLGLAVARESKTLIHSSLTYSGYLRLARFESRQSSFYYGLDVDWLAIEKGQSDFLNASHDSSGYALVAGIKTDKYDYWVRGGQGFSEAEIDDIDYRYSYTHLDLGFIYRFYRSENANISAQTIAASFLGDARWRKLFPYNQLFLPQISLAISFTDL